MEDITLTLPVLCISENCIKIKINLSFYFRKSLWCLRTFGGITNKCENKNLSSFFLFFYRIGLSKHISYQIILERYLSSIKGKPLSYQVALERYPTFINKSKLKYKKDTVVHELADKLNFVWIFMSIPSMTTNGV